MQRMLLGVTILLVGCTDKAQAEYSACLTSEASGDVFAAEFHCKNAVQTDSSSKAGKAAAVKLTELAPTVAHLREEKRKAEDAAAKAEAAEQRARFQTMPTVLAKEIRSQAMWDLGRGTETRVMTLVTKELGKPIASYEGSFGSVRSFVWGARPASESWDGLKDAPLMLRMIRDLTCGDYSDSMIEWYSEGKRLFP